MMKSSPPAWLVEARKHIGVTEIKGYAHNPVIVGFWKAAKLGGIKNDEVPWCAGFVGAMLETVGVRSARSDSSRAYLTWGVRLDQPIVGCIVVFQREGGGHVGFVTGRDSKGRLIVLGGNQSDQVNERAFAIDRVLGYRWPEAWAMNLADFSLPAIEAPNTTGEA